MLSTPDKFESSRDFVRLWRHEMHKVVYDRLMSTEDRVLFSTDIIHEAVKKEFTDTLEFVMQDPILYGDFLTLDLMQGDFHEQHRL